jgi:hypothetical protein
VGHKEEPNTPEQLHLSFGSTFLDIDQIAAMMRVPKSFIYRRTAKGHDDPIPNYRLGDTFGSSSRTSRPGSKITATSLRPNRRPLSWRRSAVPLEVDQQRPGANAEGD